MWEVGAGLENNTVGTDFVWAPQLTGYVSEHQIAVFDLYICEAVLMHNIFIFKHNFWALKFTHYVI